METYFNIKFEFNREHFRNDIINVIKHKRKGYVCIVDGNVLSYSSKSEDYRNILNGSIVNVCDGSSICFLVWLIHKKKFKTYTGPEIFEDFVNLGYKQVFLGNTTIVLEKLKIKLLSQNISLTEAYFESLPFKEVTKFDYFKIAEKLNTLNPDIIWVSLGAPKQEIFINKLIPYLNKGVLFGVGAAFNLFVNDGNIKRAPSWMRKLHLEWLFRVLQEPNRIGRRAIQYLVLIPKLIFIETNQKRKNNETTS